MKQFFYNNRFFLIPFYVFVLVGITTMILFSKPELHILLNKWNSPFADIFFKTITNLGDGLFYLIVLVLLLFIQYRYAVIFVVGSILSNIIVQLSKWLLFANAYRPSKYFELFETYKLHFVEGVKLHSLHSFPSGHTTTAFNLFFMLAIISRNNYVKLFFFFMAVATGYSRVYLSQHFVVDIVVGSIIGTACILISWYFVSKSERMWLNKSIRSIRK